MTPGLPSVTEPADPPTLAPPGGGGVEHGRSGGDGAATADARAASAGATTADAARAVSALAADLDALVRRAEASAGPAAALALLQAALGGLTDRSGLHAALPHALHHATPPGTTEAARALWRRAAAAAAASGRLHAARLADPWSSARFAPLPMRRATRHRYDAGRCAWTVDTVVIKLEAAPFAAGAMRECRRMLKLSTWGGALGGGGHAPEEDDDGTDRAGGGGASTSVLGWERAPAFVAKRYRSRPGAPPAPPSTYLMDVRTQMDAKRLADAYSRTDPPKKVDVIAACALEVHPRPPGSRTGGAAGEGDDDDDGAHLVGFYAAENAIDGEYVKYNSNAGHVAAGEGDGCPAVLDGGDCGPATSASPPSVDAASAARFTPQAFSHFTFEATDGDRIVVDIQGVGDYYTDPQIHTADGLGYGSGNLGARGIALFFLSHACNPLCGRLGLPPFQRCDADTVAASGGADKPSGGEDEGPPAPAVDAATAAAAARSAALSRCRTGLTPGAAAAAAAAASAVAVVPVGGASASRPPPPPPSLDEAVASADAAPHPPSRHARFHFEAARLHAETVALAELHPPSLVTAARRAGLFHLRRAAAGGWPAALGVLARTAAGVPPSSALLAGLVAAGKEAGEVGVDEAGSPALAAALAAAGARAGVRSAAAAAAAYAAADASSTPGGRDEAAWLAAATAPRKPRPPLPGGAAAAAAAADLEAAAEAEFAALPGGGRPEHELLAAAAKLAADRDDSAAAAELYEAAAGAATAAGAGRSAMLYYEAAAALE